MRDGNESSQVQEPLGQAGNESESTGLPLLHSWRAVYIFVLATFVLWVLLLFWLSSRFK